MKDWSRTPETIAKNGYTVGRESNQCQTNQFQYQITVISIPTLTQQTPAVLVYTPQCVRVLSYNLSCSRPAREHQCKDCAKAKYHTLSSKLTIHWDIKAFGFPCDRWLQSLFFFRTCIALSSFTTSLPHLIWHFISNWPLSWTLCSSVLLLSRSLHVQFKSLFRCISPCSFLCSILHLNLQHPSCSAVPAGFSLLDSLIASYLFVVDLTLIPTGWRPSVCRSDHWQWYNAVSDCGSATRQPAFTPSYINSLIVQLQKPF